MSDELYLTIPMNTEKILAEARRYVSGILNKDTSGHDYLHVERVVKLARKIAQQEKADAFVVELAAWLHDVGDYKLHDGIDKSEEMITAFLAEQEVAESLIIKIVTIVSQVSFSKGKHADNAEAKIVQDADRLDAIGAMGIARVFAYGGNKGNKIYSTSVTEPSSVKHFYDKLLKLKDLMHTPAARQMAEERHAFLENFLAQFHKELDMAG